MFRILDRVLTVLAILALAGCSAPESLTRPVEGRPPAAPATATRPPATAKPPLPVAGANNVAPTEQPTRFLLADGGPYHAGRRTVRYEDAGRHNRQVSVTVWYPAMPPEETAETSLQVGADCEPDLGGAPYPLILSSTKVARVFAPYLISHGFTWASVDQIETYGRWNEQMIEQPLDILFALDQVASHPPVGLEGVIDAEQAGVIGYSFDGYNALALSGARVDPEFYRAVCANDEAANRAVAAFADQYHCPPARAWDQFAACAGEAITTGEDELWTSVTDERIRAVMPLAGEGWWLFGERGLAAVDRPILMIVGTQDSLYAENALIFDHLGTADKTLISFIGGTHFMVYENEMVSRMAHVAVAFFGIHLQGHRDLADYLEGFVAQHDDLAWGVYESR